MATVYHRYLRRGEPEAAPELGREDADALKAKKAAADLQFVEEKKLQVIARRRETEIRNARAKREHWMQKLDGEWTPSVKKPPSKAKRKSRA